MKKLFYRAMPIGADLRPNDYITRKRQFAIEHAITSSIHHGEDYGVYKFFLNYNEFREADNPGEYRYAGSEKSVPLYGIAEYDDFSSNSFFKGPKDRLKNLYSWLNNNGFTKESEELEALIIKKSSGPLFDAEYMFDDQAYPYYGESEYFPDIKDEIRKEDIFYGKNVLWIGTPGKMFRVDSDYIYPIQGNIFYPEKINDVMNKIVSSEERVMLYAPYGDVTKISVDDVSESLEYEDDYGMRTLTTGDDELDEYLKDPDEFFSYLDLEEEDDRKEYEKEKARLDSELSDAITSNSGDFGKYMVQIRDGNHRAFGAVAAGEEYIWVAISDNQLQDIREGFHPDSSDLKEKINGFNKEAQEISDIDTPQVLEGHKKHLPELLEDRYRVTRQEWGDGTRTTYSYSPRTGENWKEDFETIKDPNSDWSEEKPFSYNPEIVESYEVVEDKWGTKKKPILREGWTYDIPKNEEYIYRGMSWEEYQSILKDGFIKSKGDYNIGDAQMDLTYFTSMPESAQSYAHGFAPPLYRSSIGRPAVVIAVPKRTGIKVPGTDEDEIGIKEPLKREEIKEVWFGRIFEISRDGSVDIINDAFGQRRGSSSVPSTQMAWKKQN